MSAAGARVGLSAQPVGAAESDKRPAGDADSCAQTPRPQRIVVFQQRGSGEKKIQGLRAHCNGRAELGIISIDVPLPALLDDTEDYLPRHLEADLVLDFLTHADLSHDLALLCQSLQVPIVCSGKKHRVKWAITPPT